jgi:DNA-directed RNA polymerase subunit RPC12/RpoP
MTTTLSRPVHHRRPCCGRASSIAPVAGEVDFRCSPCRRRWLVKVRPSAVMEGSFVCEWTETDWSKRRQR